MTYKEAIDFLFKSLPMYQRVGKAAYKANLDNTHKLDLYFQHPHRSFPSLHVAGTNGKGSVSHMLASVLQQSGYKTGLYTSPHLLDFRERIRINGIPLPEEEVTEFVTKHQAIIQELHSSFFEMTVAMAFDYFSRQQVEIAVIETGLGGRLDSTNIITPELSVITNISLDHTEFLGNDLHSIAREKGGIIKESIPLVVGNVQEETEQLLLSMANEKNAPVSLAYRQFEFSFNTRSQNESSIIRILDKGLDTSKVNTGLDESTITYTCDLTGDYQRENMITALTTIRSLRELGWELPEKAVKEGLALVVKNTGIMGRWQTIGFNPRSICDTAHNMAGIAAVMNQLELIPRKKLHMVWGMVNDKDLDSILPLLPREAIYYFTQSTVPRSLEPEALQRLASAYGLIGKIFPSVEDAYQQASLDAGPDDMIFTGGSTFVVADLLKASGY